MANVLLPSSPLLAAQSRTRIATNASMLMQKVVANISHAGSCTDLTMNDGSAWDDGLGSGCTIFGAHGMCGPYGLSSEPTAADACCVCGGGSAISSSGECKDNPNWAISSYGKGSSGCDDVANNPNLCTDPGFYSVAFQSACPVACGTCNPATQPAAYTSYGNGYWSNYGTGLSRANLASCQMTCTIMPLCIGISFTPDTKLCYTYLTFGTFNTASYTNYAYTRDSYQRLG